MKYSYKLFERKFGERLLNTFGEFPAGLTLKSNEFVVVYNQEDKLHTELYTNDEMCEWLEILHRETWKDKEDKMDKSIGNAPKYGEQTMAAIGATLVEGKGMWPVDAKPIPMSELGLTKDVPNYGKAPGQEGQADRINPTYYKDIVPGFQYAEMMQYMLSKFSGIEAHLMGQVYKYLMRMGGKDSDVQELSKVKWYVDFLLAYMKNGKQPISIVDIKRLLAIESQF